MMCFSLKMSEARVWEVGGRAYNLEAEEVTVGGVHCSVMCYDLTPLPSLPHTHKHVFVTSEDITLTLIHGDLV